MAREMTDEEKRSTTGSLPYGADEVARLEEPDGGTGGIRVLPREHVRGQAARGNSLEEQKRRARKPQEPEEVYADIFTGKTMERPELQKLFTSSTGVTP